MQMSETIPSGANWCQQIPGKDNFTCCNLCKREISYLCLQKHTVVQLLTVFKKKKKKDYFHGEISGKVSDEYAEKSDSKIKKTNLSIFLLFFTSPVLPWKPGTYERPPVCNLFVLCLTPSLIYHVCFSINTLCPDSWLVFTDWNSEVEIKIYGHLI